MVNQSYWRFADSPWDLLRDCKSAETDESKRPYCVMSTALGAMAIYIFPTYAIFGLFSNIHVIFVFLGKMKVKTRQLIILSLLAVGDILNVISLGWLWMFPAKGLPYATQGRVYFFIHNMNSRACGLYWFFVCATNFLSTTAFLGVCFDRLFAIFFPFKAKAYGPRSAWAACGGIFAASILAALPFVFIFGHVTFDNGITSCTTLTPHIFWSVYYKLFFGIGFFQSFLILAINIALVVKLKLVAINRRKLVNNAADGAVSQQEVKATVLIITLSLFLLVCSVPQIITYFSAFAIGYFGGDESTQRAFWNLGDIVWLFYFFQESINWIIYVWRIPEFRENVVQCSLRK